jgi:HTH-type transcriptional regulator/antitoxin HipB
MLTTPNGEIPSGTCILSDSFDSNEVMKMIVTDARSFGAALRAKRKAMGYTQAYLAEFTGFSVSFISDLERGKSTAELGKALYLANLLGLHVSLDERDGSQ